MIEQVKWLGTVVLIIGTGVNSLGMYPLGPILLIMGGLLWTIVAVKIKDTALMVTNLVMSTVGITALLFKLL